MDMLGQRHIIKPRRPYCHKQRAQPYNKPKIPHAVCQKCFIARLHIGTIVVVVANQRVRADTHPFPPNKHHYRGACQNQHQHGSEKEVKKGKKLSKPSIFGHVAARIDVD